jgi:acetyl esterase/lipase
MNKHLFIPLLILMAHSTMAQSITEMPLYEGAVPNAKKAENLEKITLKDGVFRIAEVSNPTLTRFVPVNPNGKSVIICPGGGYSILASGHEGVDVAKQFVDIGVTAFVLKYRLPSDRTANDKSVAPLQDAQQAIRLVRKNAEKWGLKANKIGIMGFSAGGHLAATATTLFSENADPSLTLFLSKNDTISVRPDFSILIYPVISFDTLIAHKGSRNNLIGDKPKAEMTKKFSNELQVTPQTPPVFLVHAGDDGAVPVENSLRFYQACIKNKVPAEMHLYAKGGHGFGLNNKTTEDKWFDRLALWLKTI